MTTETVLTNDEIMSEWEGTDNALSFARAIEQAVLQSPEIQALREDAERIRALAREFDRARRGSGDSYMPIWNALCESIGRDDDGGEMLVAISAAMEQHK